MTRSPKIRSLKGLANISKKARSSGKTIGLITGCFDILHIGHVKLFSFAKKYADLLIVGLDNDRSIRMSKGKGRPIYKINDRLVVLSALQNIDYVFEIKNVFDFGSEAANLHHRKIYETLSPDFVFTHPLADKYWREKIKRTRDLGIKLIIDNHKRSSTSSYIVEKLQKTI